MMENDYPTLVSVTNGHYTRNPNVKFRLGKGRGQSIMFGGGLETRVWRAREREPITGVWGQSPQRSPKAESLVRGSGGLRPPEAENLLASGCATEAANLPHSVRTLTLSK